jgi:PHP family Zn ribbon phosphoesterase
MIQNLGKKRKKAVQTLSQGYLNHKPFYETHIGLIFEKALNDTEQIKKYRAEIEYLIKKFSTDIEILQMDIENLTNMNTYLNDLIRLLRESWRYKIGSIIVNTLKAPLNLIKRN